MLTQKKEIFDDDNANNCPILTKLTLRINAMKYQYKTAFLLITFFSVTQVSAQSFSSWSDKTVCRLMASQPDMLEYKEEADSRGLSCASGTSSAGLTASGPTPTQATLDVTSHPRGVLSPYKTKKLWTAYKSAKQCFDHPTYGEGADLRTKLYSSEAFAKMEWRVPFSSEGASTSQAINLGIPPKPVLRVKLDETYGEQNDNINATLQWFAAAAKSVRRTDNETTKSQLKGALLEWAEANALNKGIRVTWGARPVDWQVMTAIGAILTSTAAIADTFNEQERMVVGPWLNGLMAKVAASHWKDRQDNKAYMVSYYTMIWGFLIGDDPLIQKTINTYKLAINDMRPDGSFPIDTQRSGMGLKYNSDSVGYLLMMAAMVNTNTENNLIGYTVGGRSIHSAVDFVVNSIKKPSASNRIYAIGCKGGGDRWGSVDNPNLYFIKMASYLAVYAKMYPDAEHSIWINSNYARSNDFSPTFSVPPNELF